MPSRPISARRMPTVWWWLLLVITVLPIVASAAQRSSDGWYPESDDATIVLLSRDVFSRHVPLVGMVSTGGDGLSNPELHHPGPLEFYGLAPFARSPGGPVPAVTVAVSLLAILAVATVGLAFHDLGGPSAGLLGLLAAGLAVWGLGGDVTSSVWNPDVVALPFAATIVTSCLVSVRRHRWLPVLCAWASFVAQTHLSYVGLIGLLMVWSVAVTGRDIWRQQDPDARRGHLRSVAWAVATVFVLWFPPLLQQVTGHPGNIGQIVSSLTGPGGHPVGLDGLDQLARTVGIPILGAAPAGDLVVDPTPSSILRLLPLLIPFAVTVVLIVLGRSRRDGRTVRVATTCLVALVAAAVTATRMPLADGVLFRYYGRWMWPLAATVWALLVTAAVRCVPAKRLPRIRLGALAAAALVCASIVAALPRPGAWEPWQEQRRAAGDIADEVQRSVERIGARHVIVHARGGTAFLSSGSAVALAIESGGTPTSIDMGTPLEVLPWGDHRSPNNAPAGSVDVWVVSGPRPDDLPNSARLLASSRLLDTDEAKKVKSQTRAWRDRIARSGLRAGPRRSDDPTVRAQVASALADPLGAFDRGMLGQMAAAGQVRLPAGRVDDLYTLDRLRALLAEGSVRVYLVD
ncbi:MAG: hypothetical protein KDB02_02385 [Acidimicrobiales bacterium]|nr:hypothetical protein [Acidimicrobiales bacterium]